MATFSLAELKKILQSSSGVTEHVDLDGDIADVEFSVLGYDSLAVLELISQVERRYGVLFPEDAISEMPTPALAVRYIEELLVKVRG